MRLRNLSADLENTGEWITILLSGVTRCESSDAQGKAGGLSIGTSVRMELAITTLSTYGCVSHVPLLRDFSR